MIDIDDAHREALAWFQAREGQIVPWPDPLESGVRLATQAKGIYKPQGRAHALSIKVISSGRYPDEEPVDLGEGRWRFRYHQEEPANAEAATYFTNRGLAQCMADDVPVGVMVQTKPKPNPLYRILGLCRITKWSDGFFTIEGPARIDVVSVDPELAAEPVASLLEDARERVRVEIAQRRGQGPFRAALLAAYGGRCAISGCDVEAVLEAAHIVPHRGGHTNVTSNGLLLRADLHTLFDLDLLQIDAGTMTVRVADELKATVYGEIDGRALRPPTAERDRPLADYVRERVMAYKMSADA